MSWRTVVVRSRAKLDLKLNHLVIRGVETRKIFLNEIEILIIENTAVSLTAALICELNKRKIKVIFCDENHNPSSELVNLYGSHNSSGAIRRQINWDEELKERIWTMIVKEKIANQSNLLENHNFNEYKLLNQYRDEVVLNDLTNREGHASKVYFNRIFGKTFKRDRDDAINSMLNYGYSILLSAFNRSIVATGHLTQIGIGHHNQFNHYNLSSDLMEPFRPIIDNKVYELRNKPFDKTTKLKLIAALDDQVKIDEKHQYVSKAIDIYTQSVLNALDHTKLEGVKFIGDIKDEF